MQGLLIAILLILPTVCFAQKEATNWYFGRGAGISFVNGSPEALLDGQTGFTEGCAVMSDRLTGDLLFYTDGKTVWNRSHNIMANGIDVGGHWSSTQSALIVPAPDSENLYYIFATGQLTNSIAWSPGFRYSVVDLNANSGLGVVAQRSLLLLDSTAEKQAATLHCNGEDYWVVTHHMGRNLFYAFHISKTGINPDPVISIVGEEPASFQSYGVGHLKISPDGTMIAVTVGRSDGLFHKQQLFDFDNATGIVSNARTIDDARAYYGATFSPDNSKLYLTSDFGAALYQYDLTAPDEQSIQESKALIATMPELQSVSLQIGPDGKIYISMNDALGVIHSPNAQGAACDYRSREVSLESRRSGLGLPNFIDAWFNEGDEGPLCLPPISAFEADTQLCQGDSLRVRDVSTGNPVSWLWTFEGGAPDRFEGRHPPPVWFPESGEYTVTLETGNANGSDRASLTITVTPQPVVDAGPDVTICRGEQTTLEARGAIGYQWIPASSLSDDDIAMPIATPDETTEYIVIGTNEAGCMNRDTVIVRVVERVVAQVSGDTATCTGTAIRLQASGGSEYRWTPTTYLDDPLSPTPLLTPPADANAETIEYTVQIGSGQCASTASISVSIHALPLLEIGLDTTICAGEVAMIWASGGESYEWNPQDGLSDHRSPRPEAQPEQTTEYSVTITDANGCSASASMVVEVLPQIAAVTFEVERQEDAAFPNQLRFLNVFVRGTAAALAQANINALHLALEYDAFGLGYDGTDIRSGTATPGWTWQAQELPNEGLLSIRGSGPSLAAEGTLFAVPLRVFLSDHGDLFSEVEIAEAYSPGDRACYEVSMTQGGITLSPFCLSHSRAITLTDKPFRLNAPQPNPTSETAEIRYSVGFAGHIGISVFSSLGERVRTVVDAYKSAGEYSAIIEGLPSGAYYCVMESGPFRAARALFIVR